ncbi:MAG: hypothetical protein ACP2W6_00245 [Buchnera aphidicola (Tetraneura akinire)]
MLDVFNFFLEDFHFVSLNDSIKKIVFKEFIVQVSEEVSIQIFKLM